MENAYWKTGRGGWKPSWLNGIRFWKALETGIGNLDMKLWAILFLSLNQWRNMIKVIFWENSSEFGAKDLFSWRRSVCSSAGRQTLNSLLECIGIVKHCFLMCGLHIHAPDDPGMFVKTKIRGAVFSIYYIKISGMEQELFIWTSTPGNLCQIHTEN